MKLEEGAKARGCQCSVLVLLHLHLWGETPLLLPSLAAHLLRPAPYRHPALEKTLARAHYSGKTNPSSLGLLGMAGSEGVVGRQLKERKVDSVTVNRGDTSAFR